MLLGIRNEVGEGKGIGRVVGGFFAACLQLLGDVCVNVICGEVYI